MSCLPCRIAALPLAAAMALMAGCAPALDWRELQPAGSRVMLLMPCKPVPHERRVPLAGAPVALALHACRAGDRTWGLAWADVADPARVGAALAELRSSAAANIGADASQPQPFAPRGATPSDAALRQRLAGRGPDGAPLQMELAVFTHGTQVFQASVLGVPATPDKAAAEAADADNFFASIRLAATR